MSNAIFPQYVGLAWGIHKAPTWSTAVLTAVSGKELRAAYYVRPKWKFSLTYEVLRADLVRAELQSVMAFFNLRMGRFDSFLFKHNSDSTVTDQPLGVGDGVTTVFPLLRSFGGWTEQVGYGDPTAVKLNGVSIGAYTVTDNHTTITMIAPPPAGVNVTWTGTFYYRMRFDKDAAEFEEFMQDLWNYKKIDMMGVI